ncbi:efflux RND transporter periplasmic adaptor subunit [Persephonella sp. KM09-Lau-8]|uniref:efflux RND transporter periplasmic adaptor subunit n=1 Tax=Persephonella sp. KM09-Lau-8 TaxID=1158345 RepID=UPI00049857A0|nr:efflux RND transporter periplasmic adaptor subunit [Persephonella sp. KM09-Lau-8]
MKNKLKFIIIILIIIVLVISGVRLIKKRKEEIAHLPKPEIPVYVVKGATVKQGSILVSNDILGIVRPVNTVKISSKIPGYIKKIHVKIGDKVKKGQLLVTIDPTQINNQIENTKISISNLQIQLQALKIKQQAAQTNLTTRKNIYERDKKLYEKKAISKEKLEKSLTAYKLAQAQYKEIQSAIEQINNKIKELKNNLSSLYNQLAYLKITSPVNGIVQDIILREGNLALQGKPVLSIENTDGYEIVAEIPQDYKITADTFAIVNINGKPQQFKITNVYPVAGKHHLKMIRIVLPQKPENLVSNSYINVSLAKKISGLIVPENAILHLSNGTFVLTNQEGIFKKIPIKVLGENEKFAVITGNIPQGTIVAVAEENKLRLLSLGKKGKILTAEAQNE